MQPRENTHKQTAGVSNSIISISAATNKHFNSDENNNNKNHEYNHTTAHTNKLPEGSSA
jgi:hypothetical protein